MFTINQTASVDKNHLFLNIVTQRLLGNFSKINIHIFFAIIAGDLAVCLKRNTFI